MNTGQTTAADPAAPTFPAQPLSREEVRRYSRQLLVPEWLDAGAQEKLRRSSVLVVGAGGLGGPVITQLAGAGVGRLVIADDDTVGLSNLHRQTAFTTHDVGRGKAEVAAARAQAINPHVEVTAAPRFSGLSAASLMRGTSLVVDATDNFDTRYAVADACAETDREWVWGAASGTSGLVSVFGPHLGLRDLFPSPDGAHSCDESGVLAPVPNIVGSVMALEALKVLTGVGEVLRGRLWTLEALSGRVRILSLKTRIPGPL